ncbi:MAG: hypothetical protein Q9165_004958 [Trypethelium subeluteriae]
MADTRRDVDIENGNTEATTAEDEEVAEAWRRQNLLSLGRFRMTVQDSLDEYRSLGDAVFGHPRMLTQRNVVVIKRPKYRATRLKEVVKDVTERRSEFQSHGTPLLPLNEGVCQVCITSVKTVADTGTASHPYLMRTYDGSKREYLQQDGLTHTNTGLTSGTNGTVPQSGRRRTGSRPTPRNTLNFGDAQQLPIWQVARAATAAKSYFRPLKIPIGGEGDSIFEDGGFGRLNNPSVRGKAEIKNLHGPRRLDIAVSIGTAKKAEPGGRRKIFGVLRSLSAIATDVEDAHREMSECSKPDQDNFVYFRFNAEAEQALETPLDEWEPRGIKAKIMGQRPGAKTIENITNAYRIWALDLKVQQDFRDCARALVQKRRVRARNESRWETFANVTSFKCGLAGCSRFHGAVRRDTFRKHLEEDHPEVLPEQIGGLVSQQIKSWIYRSPRGS